MLGGETLGAHGWHWKPEGSEGQGGAILLAGAAHMHKGGGTSYGHGKDPGEGEPVYAELEDDIQ